MRHEIVCLLVSQSRITIVRLFKDEWASAIKIALRHINAQHLEMNPDTVSPVVCTPCMCRMWAEKTQ